MVDVLRKISAPTMAGILAFSVAGSQTPGQARAGLEVDSGEQFVYLPDWKCDAGRFGKIRTLESDAAVRPQVSIGDGALSVTYERNDRDGVESPVFSTVIFDSDNVQKGVNGDPTKEPTVLTFFSEQCDTHVPPADRALYLR